MTEKLIELSDQLWDSDSETSGAEQSVTYRAFWTGQEISWEPISYTAEIEGKEIQFDDFTKPLGKMMLDWCRRHFDKHEDVIAADIAFVGLGGFDHERLPQSAFI